MSRVILTPGSSADIGQSQDATQNFVFYPNITSLRGANSIEQLATIGLNSLTLIEVVINGSIQFWQLQSGPATADTNASVAPLDYNVGTNNVHWQRVGGFGVNLMAAALVTTAGNVTIASGVPTAISFGNALFNSGEWTFASNPTRITAITDGIYVLTGSASFAANVTGQRKLALRINGATEITSDQLNATSALVPTNLSVSSTYKLLAGDYVELVATQTSGGALDVLFAGNYSPVLSAVRLSSLTVLDGTPVISTTPPASTTGTINKVLSIASAGWYRIWQGAYPASGSFDIIRQTNADGQTSDTLVDFTIIAGTPEGIINIGRNAQPNIGSPSIDGVRVMHDSSALLAYVDVHLLRGGTWNLIYSALDTNYLDAPFVVSDTPVASITASLTYGLKPNITGGTGTIDVTQINSSGNKLLAPNTGITWAAATGTQARTTFDTGTATLTQVAQRLKTVIDDLITQGVFQVGIPATMIYTDMLALAASLVAENTVANVTDIFRVSAAVDTTVQGIYTPVGSFNGHLFYKIQGWEYEAAGQNSPRQCYWSTAWTTWTISNLSGNLYHSGASEASPWLVVQWKDQASANVAVTTVAPNIPLTYNALTDTHTAITLLNSTNGYNGLFLRGADLNAKRRYYLVGTGSNNKRIEWTGAAWNIKDDTATYATSTDAVTFPDQVTTWVNLVNSDAIAVAGVNAVDLMSGLTLGGNVTYNGIYVPVQGVYNTLAGRLLVYRRTDGAFFLTNSGANWILTATLGGANIFTSDSNGTFPWNAAWTTASLTMQQDKIASPGWNNLAVQPNANITNNLFGNFHL